jgi:hypothetical protein
VIDAHPNHFTIEPGGSVARRDGFEPFATCATQVPPDAVQSTMPLPSTSPDPFTTIVSGKAAGSTRAVAVLSAFIVKLMVCDVDELTPAQFLKTDWPTVWLSVRVTGEPFATCAVHTPVPAAEPEVAQFRPPPVTDAAPPPRKLTLSR